MEENMKPISDQEVEEISGGKDPEVQRSNFCRRCRGAAYKLLSVENGVQVRECKTCHLIYKVQRW